MKLRLFLGAVVLTSLAGCAVPDTPATPRVQLHEVDPATGRGYYIYLPSIQRQDRDRPCPLIITCHGTPPYDVAEHHIREWKWYGETNNCIVVAPELSATDGIFGDGPIAGMLADERFIMSLISTLAYRYNIDMANIMITGFSGGGFPTYWVGLRHPDIFSVVVARNCNFSESNLVGWYPPEAVSIPIYIYYGENDPGAIQNQSINAIQYLKSMGFVVETMVIPSAGHERHPEFAMEFFRKHQRPARPSQPVGMRGR